MSNKAYKPISLSDQVDLLFPEVQRILLEDMEKRVVLSCGNRQLEHVIVKVRKNRAAAPPLWIQMGDIGHRHVIFKCQSGKPGMITIQGSRTKTARPELVRIRINLSRASKKFLLIPK